MSAIKAVLLLPSEDAEHLLEEGPCNHAPPHVVRGDACGHAAHRKWREELLAPNCYMCAYPQRALALAWDGVPVWPAIDLVDRAVSRSTATGVVMAALRGKPLKDAALPGRLIYLNSDCEEVST
jgi:hypothetical protein